jgi:hypothetical protein
MLWPPVSSRRGQFIEKLTLLAGERQLAFGGITETLLTLVSGLIIRLSASVALSPINLSA